MYFQTKDNKVEYRGKMFPYKNSNKYGTAKGKHLATLS